MKSFPFFPQHDRMDCGPACLRMIAKYYGKDYALDHLRQLCYMSREGVSLLSISDAAEKLGFRTMMAHLSEARMTEDAPLPCILHWHQEHFVVLYKIGRNSFRIADPAHGTVAVDRDSFRRAWISMADDRGTALFIEPTRSFYTRPGLQEKTKGYRFLFQYLRPFRRHLVQVLIGMIAASLISLAFPFLTQMLVDEGVAGGNRSVILLVLLSQLFLFAGSTAIEVIRSWLLLHVNARISLSIVSDFLIKLLKLPIKFFDTKSVGDISQRIADHHRIETFLTGTVLTSLFSIINIFVFAFIIAYYDRTILLVFTSLSIGGIAWIMLFQRRRKELDYRRFARNRENQDKLYEMITGMQEIKLYGSETPKRWEWERLQVRYFKLNIKSLALEQYQQTGFIFFTSLKNIIISYIAANDAVRGSMTLGGLLSISYIIGQTNGPIEQLVAFVKAAQDARLSMERLEEIHNRKEEERGHSGPAGSVSYGDIKIRDLSFQYEGPASPWVLDGVSLTIPRGKVTAIVGESGSGKTTLLKLLLGFYPPTKGDILVGEKSLQSIPPPVWRNECGSVMQDGYLFYDTIARNIALDGKKIDDKKMERAVVTANIKDFIEQLPLGYTTKIGASGAGISGGQRQRILIARSVYKDPRYLFFDEATSSLDARNETSIMDNLSEFFRDKTVLIIAHRLSTVKNADQIVVLDSGRISEIGTHESLAEAKGKYFQLVRNQLELGK